MFADITPTHKNENTMDKENCRPVSETLLPKVSRKVMQKQMIN